MSDGKKEFEGGCACGAVRYRLNAAPMFVHCCHCTSCQTETGSAFAVNALIEADEVGTTKGAAEPLLTPSESGRGQTIWRCPDCRVALWSNYAGGGGAIRFVRVGTLDTPAALPPDIHIYTRSKLPGCGCRTACRRSRNIMIRPRSGRPRASPGATAHWAATRLPDRS